MDDFTPVWRMPTQQQAAQILTTCRASTDALVEPLTPKQRTSLTSLGDGTWSIKDLLGHLATHEHRALLVMGARTPNADDATAFTDIHAFNAHHLEKKRRWSLRRVETYYQSTRDELVAAIVATDADTWTEKIPYGSGRSALGIVLGKMLNGDKFGYFAHDLAHRRGLEQAAAAFATAR